MDGQKGFRVKREDFSLAAMVSMLDSGQPFAFSRWGDGEWSAILGRGAQNCDGQAYTPDLRRALTETLRARPAYRLGVQALALRRFGPEIEAWLGREGLSDLSWSDSGILHTASIRGDLNLVIESLRRRGVILVGPPRLAALSALFPIEGHAAVPDRDAFGSLGSWASEALRLASRAGPDSVVAVSAGMGGKVLIHLLAAELPSHAVVDFGSVWEPYVGHANRTYHAKVIERLEGAAC